MINRQRVSVMDSAIAATEMRFQLTGQISTYYYDIIFREARVANDKVIALTATSERRAESFSGYAMLVALLVVIIFWVFGFFNLASDSSGWMPIVSTFLGPLLLLLILPGFYMLQPNQAAAITMFGSYKGTDRSTGLRWIWPWMAKKKVSVRANNFISEKIKVN